MNARIVRRLSNRGAIRRLQNARILATWHARVDVLQVELWARELARDVA